MHRSLPQRPVSFTQRLFFHCSALFVLALIPRAVAIGTFTTVDEGTHWFKRAGDFLNAVQTGNYAGTYLVGHPGVTTMWLGAFGELLFQQLGGSALQHQALLRLPVAIVSALAVPLAYLALRHLLGQVTALIAALLWATDPFMVAHAQLLHVDALLASFMMLALLATMLGLRWDQQVPESTRPRLRVLTGASLAAALALLTKSPALVLIPLGGVIVVLGMRRMHAAAMPPAGLARTLVASSSVLVGMGLVMSLFWIGLWPAAWVDAGGVIMRIAAEAIQNGGSPHPQGNFFLGQTVARPGLLFYPIALVLRSTPWTLLGVCLVPLALHGMPRHDPRRTVLAFLAGAALLLIAALSVMAKQFDRYALPAVPALLILAAAGLGWLWESIHRQIGNRPWAARSAGIGATVLLSLNLLAYHPYELAYYNPLVGGGATAQQSIPVGWGEGYDQVAQYLMAQPDRCVRPIAVTYRVLLDRLTCANLTRMSTFGSDGVAGYVVLYRDQLQRGYYDEATQRVWQRLTPTHIVRIHDITYAYIYRLPPPGWQSLSADFGNQAQLRGYTIATATTAGVHTLTLTLQWQALPSALRTNQLFIHVLDEHGQRVAQVDVPLTIQSNGTEAFALQQQQVPLPADLPAAQYWITIGVYDPQTNLRLPLQRSGFAADSPRSGADSLTLGFVRF